MVIVDVDQAVYDRAKALVEEDKKLYPDNKFNSIKNFIDIAISDKAKALEK